MPSESNPASLRPATPADLPAIAAIWLAGWRESHAAHVPAALAAARTPASFAERAARRITDATVAVADGAVAGFVMIAGDELDQVYVAPAQRGTGLAAALLAEAVRLIAAAGHRTAWLAVIAPNARARRFYERCGWTDAGPFDYPARVDGGTIPVRCHRYIKPCYSGTE